MEDCKGMLTLRRRRIGSVGRAHVAALQRTALLLGALGIAGLAAPARAALTVLVGEPFGSFGTMMPNGHSSIYLDRVCADGPVRLRMCAPGEPAGVVIARYDHIGDHDWLATPIMQFLYGTDHAEDALAYATQEAVEGMRQQYRRRFLAEIFPDGTETKKANGEWWETAGMAYTRRFWGYEIATTREQDERFVEAMNARANRHIYHVFRANCATFAADLVNLYFPGAVKSDHVADFGVMSPKQVARSVFAYGNAHPEAQLRVVEIPQVPGTIRRSRPVRGGAEGFLKTKRYFATLLVIQPEVAVGVLAMYLDRGRWPVARDAEIEGPEAIERHGEMLVADK
jgi:hypothetical protein